MLKSRPTFKTMSSTEPLEFKRLPIAPVSRRLNPDRRAIKYPSHLPALAAIRIRALRVKLWRRRAEAMSLHEKNLVFSVTTGPIFIWHLRLRRAACASKINSGRHLFLSLAP